jgi:hypothetical protein
MRTSHTKPPPPPIVQFSQQGPNPAPPMRQGSAPQRIPGSSIPCSSIAGSTARGGPAATAGARTAGAAAAAAAGTASDDGAAGAAAGAAGAVPAKAATAAVAGARGRRGARWIRTCAAPCRQHTANTPSHFSDSARLGTTLPRTPCEGMPHPDSTHAHGSAMLPHARPCLVTSSASGHTSESGLK